MTDHTRLHDLFREQGQSPWLDNLRRGYLTSGELAALRDRGVRGLTSNPSIFQKAIQGSSDYDDQFADLVRAGASISDDYWSLVIQDIHGACDVFERVYDESEGIDGYVSVERALKDYGVVVREIDAEPKPCTVGPVACALSTRTPST